MVMAKGVVGEGASGVRRSVTQPHLESLQDAVEAEGSVERWVWGGYVKEKKSNRSFGLRKEHGPPRQEHRNACSQ